MCSCVICRKPLCETPEECEIAYQAYKSGPVNGQCASCLLFNATKEYGMGVNLSSPPSRWVNATCNICGHKERKLEYLK